MHQDQRRRPQVDRASYNLTDIDGGLVDRPIAHILIADQHVAGVNVECGCANTGKSRISADYRIFGGWTVATSRDGPILPAGRRHLLHTRCR